MSRLLLSWVNWLDRAGASITTNSETGGLGVTRLADPILRRRWRTSPGVVNPVLSVDLGQPREVGVLALAQPDDAGGIDADGAARGWMRSPPDNVRHRLDATAPGAGGLYDTGLIPGGWVPGYGMQASVLPAAVSARHWRADIEGWSQAPGTGYLDLGRAWIGPAWRPSRGNVAYGWGRQRADGAVISANSRSGIEFVDRGPRQRVITFSLPNLSAEDADALDQLQEVAGTSRQVLALIDPDDPKTWIIGRLVEVPAITQPGFDLHATTFQIRQTL